MTHRTRGRQLQAMRAAVLAINGNICHLCGQLIDLRIPNPHGDAYVVDHVVPLARGGTDNLANLKPAHRRCNARKGAGPRQPTPSRIW